MCLVIQHQPTGNEFSVLPAGGLIQPPEPARERSRAVDGNNPMNINIELLPLWETVILFTVPRLRT